MTKNQDNDNEKFRHDHRVLQRARRLRGWKLKRLAAVASCSISTCSLVLNGKRSNSETVKAIADALGVPIEQLYPEVPR